MCGIAGVHEHRGRKAVDPSVALSMLDAIAHRGPDDEGLHLDGADRARRPTAEHHRPRRAVTSRSPTRTARSSSACNGEIYNFRALRERLLRSRATSCARTSTPRCSCTSTRSWARASSTSSTACSRSRSGTTRRQQLLARPRPARDQAALLAHDGERARVRLGDQVAAPPPRRRRAARSRRARRLPPAQVRPGAADHVRRASQALPPGHLLVSDERGVRTRRWWDLSFTRAAERRDERGRDRRAPRAACATAVRSHLVSDVPFGAFLSGGIDSQHGRRADEPGAAPRPSGPSSLGFEGRGRGSQRAAVRADGRRALRDASTRR